MERVNPGQTHDLIGTVMNRLTLENSLGKTYGKRNEAEPYRGKQIKQKPNPFARLKIKPKAVYHRNMVSVVKHQKHQI